MAKGSVDAFEGSKWHKLLHSPPLVFDRRGFGGGTIHREYATWYLLVLEAVPKTTKKKNSA